ncbi:MAG: PAS domain S-box protein [Gemmatimonadetes bacterium]|nr:PAS domain S-box protein [Gemmatimonadota bacterium]
MTVPREPVTKRHDDDRHAGPGDWRVLTADGFGHEAARELSRARLQQAHQLAGLGFWDWDAVTDETVWNDEMLRIYGISRGEFTGRGADYLAMTHPDDREMQAANIRRDFEAAAVGEPSDAGRFDARASTKLFRITRTDGTVRWVEGDAVEVVRPDGTPLRMYGVLRDVTEAQESQRELTASLARYRALVDTALDAIVSTDRSGRILLFNAAAERIFACAASDVIGQSLERFIPESSRARHHERLGQFSADNAVRRMCGEEEAVPALRANGERFFLTASISSVIVDGVPLLTIIARDVSDRLAADAERSRLYEQLMQAQKMEAIGHMTGGIAHDFNNLLSVIIGSASMLQEDETLSEDARSLIDDIAASSERAASVTRHLLAFSRKRAMVRAKVDVAETMRALTRLLGRMLGERIRVDVNAHGPCIVHGDAGLIDQMVLNLALNARDAMPEGGVLRVVVAVSPLPPPSLGPEGALHDWVCVSVIDSGAGIAPDVLPHIFEPFYTTKSAEHGTGLGLAMVASEIKQHGGAATVESELGQGTTFRLWFPQSLSEGSAAAQKEPTMRGHGEVVLLVEDEPALRHMAARLLREANFRVLEASDAMAALKLSHETDVAIDVLFTDLILPGEMNGVELAAALQARYPQATVLLTTGYDSAAMLSTERLRAHHVLLKPYRPFDLISAISGIVAART